MAVKHFKKRKGERWYDVAERKFGNRDYGNDLIRQFGQGRTGVKYRFNTKNLTGRVGTALAGQLGMNPWGLEAGEVPSDFDPGEYGKDFQTMFSQFFDGVGGTGGLVKPVSKYDTTTAEAIDAALGGRPATGGPLESGRLRTLPTYKGGPLEERRLPTYEARATGGPLEGGRRAAGTGGTPQQIRLLGEKIQRLQAGQPTMELPEKLKVV